MHAATRTVCHSLQLRHTCQLSGPARFHSPLHSHRNLLRRSREEAFKAAEQLGFPVMVRPSYVLGGRAMEVCYNEGHLDSYLKNAVTASEDKPVLVDKYLAGATELDVDALCDKDGNVTICGIMEHIEEAGVHSGDSACSLPPQTIPEATLDEMRDWTARIARQLQVIGLINVQYCIKGGDLYIIEANPRASRTVPFVAKAIGHPIAAYASLLMSGKTLPELNFMEEPKVDHVAVKEVVLPFSKFPGADLLLGPEMRSTGAHSCPATCWWARLRDDAQHAADLAARMRWCCASTLAGSM